MARTNKQILKAKSGAFDAFAVLLQDQPDKSKGVMSKDKVYHKDTPQFVRDQYESYKKAKDAFKRVRMELMLAKTNLQYALDIPLYESKKISQARHWDFNIDEQGNIKYQDDDDDFVEKFKQFMRRHNKDMARQQMVDDVFFDSRWDQPKKAEDLMNGASQNPTAGVPPSTGTGTPGSTAGGSATDAPKGKDQRFLDDTTILERVASYTNKGLTKEQRIDIFENKLTDEEANSLWNSSALSEEYKKEVEHLMTGGISKRKRKPK